MSLKIFGAGMAGLLAAHALRRHDPIVHEAQESLPHNHRALLRFRTNKVSELTGIPFKAVHVQKAVAWDGEVHDRASIAMNNSYSMKVTGRVAGRSILNLEPVQRFIAPPDFIMRLAAGVRVVYNSRMTQPEECVSTIPMPLLMEVLGLDKPAAVFEAKKIWTVTFDIASPDVDVYQTVYMADPEDCMYRVSITGSHVTCEFTHPPTEHQVSLEYHQNILWQYFGITPFSCFGHFEIHNQKFGKLLPVDEETRRAFILHATDAHRIYSVGRFATWRQIILDDVVDDLRIVDRMLTQRSRYASLLDLHK